MNLSTSSLGNGTQMAVPSFVLAIGPNPHPHLSSSAIFSCAIDRQMERDSTGVNLKADTLYHGEV